MKKNSLLIFYLLLVLFSQAQEKPEGLFINSKAPDFRGKDQHGQDIRLRDVRKDSLVVLVFYRGYWSPYCTKNLKTLEDSLYLINAKGARLIAVSPEKPESIQKTIEKSNAGFSIVFDSDMKIMKAYDVAFEVDGVTVNRYRNGDIDLAAINGQKDKAYLPVPALYIIDKEGSIIYRYFEFDYKKRVSVHEILEQLK